jgi:hypothetical protein
LIFEIKAKMVRFPVGASDLKKPPTDNVEWFEHKGNLGELPDLGLNFRLFFGKTVRVPLGLQYPFDDIIERVLYFCTLRKGTNQMNLDIGLVPLMKKLDKLISNNAQFGRLTRFCKMEDHEKNLVRYK